MQVLLDSQKDSYGMTVLRMYDKPTHGHLLSPRFSASPFLRVNRNVGTKKNVGFTDKRFTVTRKRAGVG